MSDFCGYVKTIAADKNGNIWFGFGEFGSGIVKFDGINWTSLIIPDDSKNGNGHQANIIVINNSDEKWIGTNNGVKKYSGN